MDRDQLNTAMDACRPGDEDVGSPEMSQLAEVIETDEALRKVLGRSQRLDGKIIDAMKQVVVPDSLQQKLLDQARQQSGRNEAQSSSALAKQDSEGPESLGGESQVAEETPSHVVSKRRLSRSAVLVGSLAVLALGVLLMIALGPSPDKPIQPSEFAESVLGELDRASEGWRTTAPPLARFPLPRRLAPRWRVVKWRKLPKDLGNGVVYQIADHTAVRYAVSRRLSKRDKVVGAGRIMSPTGMSGGFGRYGMGAAVELTGGGRYLVLLLVDPKDEYHRFFETNLG